MEHFSVTNLFTDKKKEFTTIQPLTETFSVMTDIFSKLKPQLIENFNVGPYREGGGPKSGSREDVYIKKYNLSQRDVYDTLVNAEKPASELSEDLKEKRIKMLNLMIDILDNDNDFNNGINNIPIKNFPLSFENRKSAVKLVKRTLELHLKDAKGECDSGGGGSGGSNITLIIVLILVIMSCLVATIAHAFR
jgi:hypothetical protein